MAGAAGLEPVTSAVTGQRSNQLSYAPTGADNLGNGRRQVNGQIVKNDSGNGRQGGGGGEPR